jgi:hypothetical protein
VLPEVHIRPVTRGGRLRGVPLTELREHERRPLGGRLPDRLPILRENDYSIDNKSKLPAPIRSARTYYADAAATTITAREVTEFAIYKTNPMPESFFTFEDAGLPDVTNNDYGNLMWFWLLNAGIVVLAVAAWLPRRYFNQRQIT